MIVKEAEKSIKLCQYEALLRRLSPLHAKRATIEKEWKRSLSGHRGEKSLDYYLHLLPKGTFHIFHGLRLETDSQFFQMDILLVSPSFLLIIEVKNISGTLIFDRIFQQLIRIKDEKEEVFPDPISQVYRQRHLLTRWLEKHRFPSIPIESIVVISNPSTYIKTIPVNTNISKTVMHSTNLLASIQNHSKVHPQEKLTAKEIKKLSRILLKKHTPSHPDIMKQFGISETELKKGVLCPECETIPMIKVKSRWYCTECRLFSKDAHIQALKDFSLLLGPAITNQQCCDFLQLSSRNVAYRILKALDFPAIRTKRHRKYLLEFDDF
jgi:hypothetical protein